MKHFVARISLFVLRMLLIVLISIGLYHFGTFAFTFGRQIYSEEGITAAPGKDVAVVVSEGESTKEIAQMLKQFGLISDPYVFLVQERLSEYHGQIQPGNYVLNTSQSGNQMIVDERMVTYINSLDTGSGQFLDQLELQAKKDRVPIIRREMQSFLKVLLQIKKPTKILEVGTAVGFSALLMAKYTPEDTRIVTIEKYEKRIPVAKANFQAAGMDHRITLLEGDALEILREMEDSFDFIFMDAAKGQYIHFYPEVMRLLAPEGILVSDNVLQEGDLIESHFAVERRNRTIYKRMREYLYVLKHDERLETSILPVGDGAAVSYKMKTERQ